MFQYLRDTFIGNYPVLNKDNFYYNISVSLFPSEVEDDQFF